MSAASFDVPGANRDLGPGTCRDEDFPGCESFHLPASKLDHCECRLAFRDGITETAWKVCEPTSIQHEALSRLLVQMAGQFAMVRGLAHAPCGPALQGREVERPETIRGGTNSARPRAP